jgi:microcystin-dependent protein
MSNPFLGEIRVFGFNFAPTGWFLCEGQLLPISQYTALFSLLGTTYGGDGRSTFALPDFRGRAPVHQGNGTVLGEAGGAETVTLLQNNLPVHSHSFNVSNEVATTQAPANAYLAQPEQGGPALYISSAPSAAMADSIDSAGGGQPFSTRQPTLVLNYCIAHNGVFPARN